MTADHDVVIVGAGIAGALMAKRLTGAGLKVLILEAGPGTTFSFIDYSRHLDQFYAADRKGPEAPWTAGIGAPHPTTVPAAPGAGGFPIVGDYMVQRGPHIYGSTYTRTLGGSTLHWLGVCLRMLPQDFRLHSDHRVGKDWPIGYADLAPWYEQAEHEIGVSADVAEQRYLGHRFSAGYDYPMHPIPPSYSDRVLATAIDGMRLPVGDESVTLRVRAYPAGRNSTPRGRYRPQGAIDLQPDGSSRALRIGERCEGNTSCTPICPVQAKYNATKSLAQADRRLLEIRTQAVATLILVDRVTGDVVGIRYRRYEGAIANGADEAVATGRIYVLAAHAVENAKLLLASDVANRSGAVGRNLMDHPTLYAYGTAPGPIGAFRGPQSSSGIEDFRGGGFRGRHAAFRFDIGNDGWRAPTGAPDTTVAAAIFGRGLYGNALRRDLADRLSRQVRLSLAVEQLPDEDNRVTIDPRFRDALGTPRPVISYRIAGYTLDGMAAAQDVAQAIFRQAGIADASGSPSELPFPVAEHGGRTYRYHGMGHFAGTHAMGDDPKTSVVDSDQRCWDHRNLFLLGSGSFPTMGTSNPTLTLAALALRSAETVIADARR